MKYKACFFLTIVLIFSGCSKDPASTEQPPELVKREMVLFASDRNGGNMNIWMMEKDGSNPRQVTFYTEGDYFPADVSSDGKTLLFYRWDARTLVSRIFVMPTIGPQPDPKQFLISFLCEPGNFFPDGQRFVYTQHTIVSDTNSHDAVYIYDLRDSSNTLLTPLGNSQRYAAWYPSVSPDGNKVCYVKAYYGFPGSFLVMQNLATTEVDTIIPGNWGRNVHKGVFKNPNELIITAESLNPNPNIHFLSILSGNLILLTDFLYPYSAYTPSVDEAETTIYFRYNDGLEPDTTSEIARIDINGDNFKILTNNNYREGSPVVGVLEFYE